MKINKDFDLSKVLWYKIGGKAKYFLEVSNRRDLLTAIDFINRNKITNYLIIGAGSNMLFPDYDFVGVVVQLKPDNNIKLVNENVIEAFAGEKLDDVINFSFEHNLIGLEWAGGMPGTIGAAVRGNAGAFGGELKDVFKSAEIINISNNEITNLNKDDMNFSYRESVVKQNENLLILSVRFFLKKASNDEVEKAKKVYFSNIKYRKEKHPLDFANCGSVFKNIIDEENVKKILSVWPDIKDKVDNNWHGKIAMAYIINRLGFSGFKIGNAKVSEKHNNFIVNLGNAKCSDVLHIVAAIKKKFFDTFGFLPETEVEIIRYN